MANHRKACAINKTKYFKKPPNEFVGKECFREFEKRSEVCEHCPGTKAMETGWPGEKLYEELFNSDEIIEKTSHPKIYQVISNGRVSRNALETLMSLNNVEVFRDSSNIKCVFNMLI